MRIGPTRTVAPVCSGSSFSARRGSVVKESERPLELTREPARVLVGKAIAVPVQKRLAARVRKQRADMAVHRAGALRYEPAGAREQETDEADIVLRFA